MTAILEKIAFYWTYPFVRYALIVGVLIALCSSLLGVTLVLKRFSFIGDGLRKNEIGYLPQQTVVQKDFPASVREIILSGCQGHCGSRPCGLCRYASRVPKKIVSPT